MDQSSIHKAGETLGPGQCFRSQCEMGAEANRYLGLYGQPVWLLSEFQTRPGLRKGWLALQEGHQRPSSGLSTHMCVHHEPHAHYRAILFWDRDLHLTEL